LARPASTGSSKWKSRFVTPPAEVNHDDHHDLGLEKQHLDAHDRRRLEGRRRDEREQTRHLREHVGRRLERRLDLGARRVQVERELGRLGIEPVEQLVRVVAIAALGRNAPRRGVGMREQAERLELGELGADRRRRRGEPGGLDERLRAHGLARRDVFLDDAPQDLLLTRGEQSSTGRLGAHLQSNFSGVCGGRAAALRRAARP